MTRISRFYMRGPNWSTDERLMCSVMENGVRTVAYFAFREYDMAWHRV